MVLITGATGNLGRRLASALAEKGYRVRALCLPDDPWAARLAGPSVEAVAGDITRKETLAPALEGVRIVFHLAAALIAPGDPGLLDAVNSQGTRNLVEAAEAQDVEHFIYVSSISVEYPVSNAYARSKLRGEEWVRRSYIPFTIVRPTLAYQEGGSLEFMRFVEHLKRSGRVAWLPEGGRCLKSPVHVDDLVSAFLALPGNPRAVGKTYALSGGDNLTLKEMARLLLAHMGRPKPVWSIPGWLCLAAIAFFRARSKATGRESPFTWQTYTGLVQDAAPPHHEAAEDLGYAPRPFRQGLATLVSLRDCLRGA